MEFHRGRLIDHVQLSVRDLEASRRFHAAALGVLGDSGRGRVARLLFRLRDVRFARPPFTGRTHLAFQAADRETVGRFHTAGFAAGGRDNGPPGGRHYHPGYYAVFLLDPDGNKSRRFTMVPPSGVRLQSS